MPSATPIQPIVVGSADAATRMAGALKARGVFVPAIRSPTVPANSARLRITLSASHSPAMVDLLIAALRDLAFAP